MSALPAVTPKPVQTFPPEPPDDEVSSYIEAFNNVVTGQPCDFYPDEDIFAFYDVGQADAVLDAIRLAASLIVADDGARWRIVQTALVQQAERYASQKAREAGE